VALTRSTPTGTATMLAHPGMATPAMGPDRQVFVGILAVGSRAPGTHPEVSHANARPPSALLPALLRTGFPKWVEGPPCTRGPPARGISIRPMSPWGQSRSFRAV